MNFHSPEASALAAMRERLEEAQEECRLLREALTMTSDRVPLMRQLLNLTIYEGRIVDMLLNAKGHIVSRAKIAHRLYGLAGAPNFGEGGDRTVDVLLAKARVKLRRFNKSVEIKTHWNAGWCIHLDHRSIILAHLGETMPTVSN